MGVEAGWRPHASGLEGRHDEWKPSGVLAARPAAALTLTRSSPAPNVKDLDLATCLQLERVELCAPNCAGARTHTSSVHRRSLASRRGRVRRRRVSPIGSEKKRYLFSDPRFLQGWVSYR